MATILKRYSNRRLYDTRQSRYITLEELAQRIRAGEDFQVLDADTGEDRTRRILLQVVLLESLDVAELLPVDFLKTLIRLQDGRLRELFARYLRMSMDGFSIAQKQVEENMRLMQEQMSATANLMRNLIPFAGGLPRFTSRVGASRSVGDAAEAEGRRSTGEGAAPEMDTGTGMGAETGRDADGDELYADPVAPPWEVRGPRARPASSRAKRRKRGA